MCHSLLAHSVQYKRPAGQRGSMLVIALFVIVIFAVLGATMMRMVSVSASSVVHEVFGLKALHAAQSAMQIKIAQSFSGDGAPTCDAPVGGPLTMAFNGVEGLQGCMAAASCTTTTFEPEGLVYVRFTSMGRCVVGDWITNRQVKVDASWQP